MQRSFFIATGLVAIVLMAAGLTEATLARGQRAGLSDGTLTVATAHPTPTPKPVATPTPTVKPSASPTPSTASSGPTATTNAFVHLRASASTNSAIIENLDGGTVVTLGDYQDDLWQGVTVDGVSGYIYRSYLNY